MVYYTTQADVGVHLHKNCLSLHVICSIGLASENGLMGVGEITFIRGRSVGQSKPPLNMAFTCSCPVSNLNYLSTVIERVVVKQINSHIKSSDTSNHYQSVYGKLHSIETS